MAKKKIKAEPRAMILVSKETHRKLKVQAAELGRTLQNHIEELAKTHDKK